MTGFCRAHFKEQPCAGCAKTRTATLAQWADPVGRLKLTEYHLKPSTGEPRRCQTCGVVVKGRKALYCADCRLAAQRQRHDERWARPEYREAVMALLHSNRQKQVHHLAWTREEENLLRELVGTMPYRLIARRLTELSGVPRGARGVGQRARDLGLDTLRRDWAERDLVRIFGVSRPTVKRWREEGYLPMGQYGSVWAVTADAIRKFIADYPWQYDAEDMVRGPFRSLAEVVQRRDPWWTSARLRLELGIPGRSPLTTAYASGVLTIRRRGGSHGGQIVVRAADVPAYLEWRAQRISQLPGWRQRRARQIQLRSQKAAA
jgi:hypothetical protein